MSRGEEASYTAKITAREAQNVGRVFETIWVEN
jgi:hypothetical protein